MTHGQAKCLTDDSLRAAYWEAHRADDQDTLMACRCEMIWRGIRP